MKSLMFVIAATVAFSLTAAETKSGSAGKSPMTEAEKAAKRQLMLEKTGGMIQKPGQGKVVVVNCQKKIESKQIADRMEQYNKAMRVNYAVVDGTWKFGDGVPAGAKIALFLVDDPAIPLTLYSPEACWGVLNVAKLGDPERFSKAFARAVTMTFGAGVSQMKNSPMQPVSSPEDLDKIVAPGITFDALGSIMRNLQGLGITQSKVTTYRKACMEGWAPTPTNDFQKVIWEEVHSNPTNPMKIKFDPKKGE